MVSSAVAFSASSFVQSSGVIEGTSDKASVVANVSQTSNVISPGYVIRRPASRAEAAP
jgi:hypothetical protein